MLTTFALIALAELGDKSQLVCMALASRHPPLPVFLGAVVAFALLNGLAVGLGAGLASAIPEAALAACVAVMFGAFGALTLWQAGEEEEAPAADAPATGRGVFWTAVAMLFLAELGDKTQLTVAGLAATSDPVEVWLGASAALWAVSGVGVLVGRVLLQRLPLRWLHRASGVFFLLLAGLAAHRAISSWTALAP